jgi:hypothetical protein
MDLRKAYSNLSLSMRMLVILSRYFTFFVILLSSFHFIPLTAQEAVGYDEIPIFLDVPHLGGTDMTAVIKGEELYLPVTDLFDFLNQSRCSLSD